MQLTLLSLLLLFFLQRACQYGLVFPGVGWLVFRNKAAMSPELAFHTNYLGSDQPSITLNFSKPASTVLAQ